MRVYATQKRARFSSLLQGNGRETWLKWTEKHFDWLKHLRAATSYTCHSRTKTKQQPRLAVTANKT